MERTELAADPHAQIPSNATDPWDNPYPPWVVTEADRARYDICHRIAEALWRQYDTSGTTVPSGGWMVQTVRSIYRMPFVTGSPDEIDGIAREIAEGKKMVHEAFGQENTEEPATAPVDAPAPEPDTSPEGETTVGKPGSGEPSEGGKEG